MEYPLPVIDSRQAEATGAYVAFEIGNAAFGFDLPLKQKIVGYIGSFNFLFKHESRFTGYHSFAHTAASN